MDKTIIALSLQQKAIETPLHPFVVTKGDIQAYRLEIRIFDGDKEFPYTQAATARLVFANDKGLITTNDNGSINETGITYDIGATEISFPGRVVAAVQVLDAEGKRLTVSRFLYDVLADPLDAGQPLPTVPEVEQLMGYITAVEQALDDVYGGVHISGTYATYEDFIAAHPTGNTGDLYLVDGSVYAWVDTTNEWLNVGLIADVRTQMSITSDGGGLKLDGDEQAPDDNKFYGVIGRAKGFYCIPKQMSIISDDKGLKLEGDEATPTNESFYGIRSGTKGFYVPRLYNPNLIINGNFDIWQRGTSQTSSGYGSDDRWANLNNGSTKTVTRQAFTGGQLDVPNNPNYYSRTVVNSVIGSSSYVFKRQRIEDVNTLSGETITLSFWAKADANKNISLDFAQNFGLGGSAEISAIGAQKIALTTSWVKYTVTVDIPSVSGKIIGANSHLGLRIWFDAGSAFNTPSDSLGNQSGTFDIAQVKLEKGSVATPFVPKTFAEELRDCQRYCYPLVSNGVGGEYARPTIGIAGSSTLIDCLVKFPKMRKSPTFVYSGSFTFSNSAVAVSITSISVQSSNNTDNSIMLRAIVTGATTGNPYYLQRNNNITAKACLDAEL